MPNLSDALRNKELGFLRMVAGLWGAEIDAPDAAAFLPRLVEAIAGGLEKDEVLAALPGEARLALQDLAARGGRIPWAQFTRRYGEVRPFGAGRRDKERPDLKPASISEWLWYRALIGRAFLKDPGIQAAEYAYLPEEIAPWIHPLVPETDQPSGRPATPVESAHACPATDGILDQACSLLAWLRLGQPLENFAVQPGEADAGFLHALLREAHLVDSDDMPMADEVREFLEKPRGEALLQLAHAWMEARYLNELRLMPELICEGDWYNDPRQARAAVVDWVGRIPAGRWWSLVGLLRALHQRQPDYLRSAGDYDAWFIRDRRSGEFLRGFESWESVDGAMAAYIVTGPLHWLGIVDLAAPQAGAEQAAFRLSAWAEDLLGLRAPQGLRSEEAALYVNSAGRISIPMGFPRAARYQIARLCAWDAMSADGFRYHITPDALTRAKVQGLRPQHLAGLLRRHAEGGLVPPAVLQALERWETLGTQAGLRKALLLRVAHAEILTALRKSRGGRYIEEELTPTLALLVPGCAEKVGEVLFELGYLSESRLDETE